jgi:hypothetical protein
MEMGLERAIREPETRTPQEYAHRVHQLAATYALLFTISLVGIALLVWQAQLLVTLAQRSNVETLTIAFLLIFFTYTAALSAPGAISALRIVRFAILARRNGDFAAVEQRKVAALGSRRGMPATVMLNLALDREQSPCEPFRLTVADTAGSAGVLAIDGVELTHLKALREGSNSLLAYTVEQIVAVLAERGVSADLDIVEWQKLDDEAARKYAGTVRFARNLERHFGGVELWPRLTLTEADCHELERRLTAVCPALRNEAFLPDWEYAGEHKIPLIPEPLGLISLSRSEKRVDPTAGIGIATLIVLIMVVVMAVLILAPPWVPGK